MYYIDSGRSCFAKRLVENEIEFPSAVQLVLIVSFFTKSECVRVKWLFKRIV